MRYKIDKNVEITKKYTPTSKDNLDRIKELELLGIQMDVGDSIGNLNDFEARRLFIFINKFHGPHPYVNRGYAIQRVQSDGTQRVWRVDPEINSTIKLAAFI